MGKSRKGLWWWTDEKAVYPEYRKNESRAADTGALDSVVLENKLITKKSSYISNSKRTIEFEILPFSKVLINKSRFLATNRSTLNIKNRSVFSLFSAMFNFILLVLLVFLLNRFLTKKAIQPSVSKQTNKSNNSSKMVQVIQSEAEFKTAISAANLVVVDFFAVWCGPCKMIAPMLEKFSNDYANVSFYKVDVDQLPTVASSNEVSSMPTLLFFKNGELVGKVIGANPGAIKQTIDKLA